MPKFYVTSGKVRRVIDTSDPLIAARHVVRAHATAPTPKEHEIAVSQLGLMTKVSERGYHNKDAMSFPTHYLMVDE
jgi:hypothetical protein